MPLNPSDFPEEVQVAFFMFSLLPEHWEGMSGTYMGKYWDGIEYFFKLYEVDDRKTILYIMKIYESKLVNYRAEQAEIKRTNEARKAKSGGKHYTHNVKGKKRKKFKLILKSTAKCRKLQCLQKSCGNN